MERGRAQEFIPSTPQRKSVFAKAKMCAVPHGPPVYNYVVIADKENLRLRKKAERLAMPPDDVEVKSRIIVRRLIEGTDWSKIKSLHVYLPITKLNEVNTLPLLDYLQANWPKIKVTTQTKSREFPQDNKKFDLIVVPMLAFDEKCNRLGWGGGWYDRFLADQPQALKVGLAYESGFVEEGLPTEPHDIALDQIITEGFSFIKSD